MSFGKMILCDRCRTSYDLASLLCGRRNTLDRWSGKTHWYEAVSSALNFPFLKDVSQNCFVIASFLILPTSNIEEVSQNCIAVDVIKVKKFRTSRRIAAFLMLPSSKIEEVSQNSFVFKLADREIDG